ncbi:MAG: glycosyltransferase [Planctomycetaceae bacterium]
MQTHKPWIFGTVPSPVGGVAVFLSRLIASHGRSFGGIVDPYYGDRKTDLSIAHIRARGDGLFERVRVMSHLWRLRDRPLFVNGSRPESVLALSPFLVHRHAPSALLLHHGDLEKTIRVRPWLRPVVRRVLASYQQIGCLSDSQREFYLSLGITPKRLQLIETYLPPSRGPGDVGLSPLAIETMAWLDRSQLPVFVGSGYAYPYYRHDWGLDYLSDEIRTGKSRYLLCCYGPETEHLEELRKRFAGHGNARVVFGLEPFEFDRVLAQCQVYIRPTDTDSYGMATRDALGNGLTVVASNACERASGVMVHKVGDRDGFFALLDRAVNASRQDRGGQDVYHDGEQPSSRLSVVDWIAELSDRCW